MTGRLLRVLVVLALAGQVAGGAGCSKRETAASRANAAAAAAALADGEAAADVEPDQLLEKEPKTKTDRLIAQAEKSASFCEAWDTLDKLEQPAIDDVEELVVYIDKAYHAWFRIDPARKVQERVPAQRGRPATVRHIELPPEVRADIDTVRKALFAYWVRVGAFTEWLKVKKVDQAGYEQRMQMAFAALTADEVTQAQQRLMAFEASHC